jgi:hypothetical protein
MEEENTRDSQPRSPRTPRSAADRRANALALLLQQLVALHSAGLLSSDQFESMTRAAAGEANPNGASGSSNTRGKAKEPEVWSGDDNSESWEEWHFRTQLYLTASGIPESKWVLTTCSYLGKQPLAHAKQKVTANMLASGNVTVSWGDFKEHMGKYAGGKTPTQLSVLLELFSFRTDKDKSVSTASMVNKVEALFGKLVSPLTDVTKIAIVWRAIHPVLRSLVGYMPSGQEWPTYEAFRTNLLSRAAHWDCCQAQRQQALYRSHQGRQQAGRAQGHLQAQRQQAR